MLVHVKRRREDLDRAAARVVVGRIDLRRIARERITFFCGVPYMSAAEKALVAMPTVSMTSVSPSQRPTASPMGEGTSWEGCVAFMRMWRTLSSWL